VKWIIILLIVLPLAQAKAHSIYESRYGETADLRDRLLLTYHYPDPAKVSTTRFLEDPLRPGTSTVRWTEKGAYSINLDRVHLTRRNYTLIIKSKYGPEIRMLPFTATKIYLAPNYFGINYDKETYTVWLAKYAD